MNRFTGLLLALLLMMGSILAEEARARVWTAYTDYRSPYVTALPAGEPTQPRTRRLIVLVLRGLRFDASENMPALNALRGRGAAVALEHADPTWQIPVWLTLFTGARVETHGASTNRSPRNPEIDSIFARMAALNQNSVLIGSSTWNDLFGAAVQRAEVIEADDAAQQDALAMDALLQTLRDPNAPERLIVTELALLEATARSGPEAYLAAASATDIRIKTVIDSADLANNTLIVLSDRGLTAAGEDGGAEPEIARAPMVLAGAGIRPGTQTIAQPADVAPSLAVLLGTPIPAQAQGAPIWDVLDSSAFLTSARQLTAFYEGWAETARRPRFAAELTRPYEVELAAGQRARFDVWQAALNQAASDARAAKLGETQSERLPLILGAAIFLLAAAGIALGNRALPALLGAAAFGIGWVIDFYLVRGLAPSLTLFRDGDPAGAFAWIARDCALLYGLASLVASIAAALLSETVSEAITAVMGALVVIGAACAAQFLWFYWTWSDTFVWALPDGGAVAAVTLALTQLAALNVSISSALPALPIPLLAIGLAVLARGLLGARARVPY